MKLMKNMSSRLFWVCEKKWWSMLLRFGLGLGIVGQDISGYDAQEMDEHLANEDDKLLSVLVLWQTARFLHGIRYADAQTNDEDDNEHDQADEQVAADLAPHAQDGPDDDGGKQDAQGDVGHVGPVEAGREESYGIAYDIVIDECTD